MDFAYSPRVQALQQQVQRFMDDLILPSHRDWHRWADAGVYPIDVIEPLKAQARDMGLWNLFLPGLQAGEPGTRLTNLEYAPLAEIMGRVPWASEVFNCSAPDTGNIELLHLFASDAQRTRWLRPLMDGAIRSCFAMSEPDVASSDPTNLGTRIARQGDDYLLNGRKWFITGAAHPNCQLAIVMGVSDPSPDAPAHRRHSMLLVPMDAPGVEIVRNIPVMQHQAIEGHCELLFRDVRVPAANLLGAEGEGFAMAQARLGPGRVHHCMRTIGQCELALQLAAERALERHAFGKPLSEQSNVQEWLADSRIEIDQARWLVLHAAWLLDQGDAAEPRQVRAQVAAITVVAARLPQRVVDRAMQIFGAMGLSPDTPLAAFWTWGRALRLMDGPDEVHLRTVARQVLAQARTGLGSHTAYFTTPEQLAAPPHLQA